MEGDHRYGETSNNAKRLKLDKEEEGGQNKTAFAIAVHGGEEEKDKADANDGSSASILKLDIDCCEELFAFLSLVDLHSLGRTCKRMHQYTGYFVRENYKSTEFRWRNGNLCFDGKKMNGFIEFISYLYIRSDQLERFAEFAPRFKSIRKLILHLYGDKIDCIKEILHKCEEIEIYFGDKVLTIDLYEKILKFCKNIKYFKLNSLKFYYGTMLKNNNWLLHEYPKLESLDLYSDLFKNPSIAKIRTFFTLNKGIRKFQTNFMCLWDCRHWIMDTDIKLDELLVGCACLSYNGFNREHINLLNTLYERDFYKHLSLLKVFRYDSSILAEIRAPLTMDMFYIISPLPPLNLKVIEYHGVKNLENILTNNLSTIEQIYCPCLNTVNVLFFIQNCIKLREIKIDYLTDLNPLNLAQLNEERKKLAGAKIVTIYFKKCNYGETIKMTDCKLVKIKRIN